MTRFLIQILLPLLLPAIFYILWAWLARGRKVPESFAATLQKGRWFWLIVCGVILMGGGLTVTAFTTGGEAGSTYTAPRWEDGRIVPGRIEPKPQ